MSVALRVPVAPAGGVPALGLVDHCRAPILEALWAYRAAGVVPFSTPGHKLGAGAGKEVRALLGGEVFAADVWLNTGDAAAALAEAEELAADAWGAERSFYLVDGASGGNRAFLLAALRPGDVVVVARDVHQSLLAGLILTGARPVYVAPRLHPEFDVSLGIAPEDVAATLAAHPNAKLVALVSPTYWGVASDLGKTVEVAHRRGVPVYVDEAWGPHLGFHPAFPASAMASGADGAVASPHKLLTGLSQAAVLHVQGSRVDADRLAATVKLTRTTSPLLPILASLDACRRQMALAGRDLLDLAIELAEATRRRLRALPGVRVLDHADLGLPAERFDPTRLVIDVQGLGLTGIEVERELRGRFGVAPELSDVLGVVCLVTVGDTLESVDRLVDAFAALAAERAGWRGARLRLLRSSGEIVAPGPQAMTPREAFFAPSRAVALAAAAGEVAAESVVPFPPGILVLAQGEVITPAKLTYLRDAVRLGLHVCGPADPTLATLRVVDA